MLQWWYETAANQGTLVEIELLATVGWKWGCQPFSHRGSQNVTRCPKEICLTCLFQESIPTICLGNAKHPLPTRSLRLLRAAVHSSSPALWLHHSHPCVAAAEKTLSHAKKQRVWSRSCGVQDVLQWWYETAANQGTLVEIELLATVGWKWGCQPFSHRGSQNVTRCPKEICLTCLFQESIPAICLGNAKHPLPTRSLRLLRAAVHPSSPALWLHHSHPSVAAAEKTLSHAKKQRVWSRSCGVQDLLQWWYETAASQGTLVEIELLATVGWKWGCQPFSHRGSQNVTGCPKEICSTCLSNPPFLLRFSSIHSLPEA